MKHRELCLIPIAAVLAGAAACGPPNDNAKVVVDYDQVANFYDYRLAPDSLGSFGAGDGMFILYKITAITNKGSQAKTFTFDKHKVVTLAPDQISNDEPSGDNILLGNKLATSLTVGPGQKKKNPGCILKRAATNDPESLASTSALVPIMYQIDDAQPVDMNRVYGDTSTATVSNALPNTLQGLCGG